jgi:hypothetical protein
MAQPDLYVAWGVLGNDGTVLALSMALIVSVVSEHHLKVEHSAAVIDDVHRSCAVGVDRVSLVLIEVKCRLPAPGSPVGIETIASRKAACSVERLERHSVDKNW